MASIGISIQNDNIPLTVESEPNFQKISTTFVIVLQIFTVVGNFVIFEIVKKKLKFFILKDIS